MADERAKEPQECVEADCGVASFSRGLCRKHYNRWYRGRPGYYTWAQMISRCQVRSNPKFPYYGGRGIRVCERWHSYENFLTDMGHRPNLRHSLDRIDNDGNYEPSNCRWATKIEQARNTRRNVTIEYRGVTKILIEWAESTGLPYKTLHARLFSHGWSIQRALETPLMRQGNG